MMKFMIVVSAMLFFGSAAYADVGCKVNAGWSLQFNSGDSLTFTEAYQVLKDGSRSTADVVLQQVYESPAEFKARVELNGQSVEIRTSLSSRNEEYAIYTGTLTNDGVLEVVTCNQN